MVETTKQVRVDNWGIYFLQRLQLFFSKTDYCDLTLQFEGNVQLKVHRLVMNACTEYFSFLEQTCPALGENTIMMPSDLQAEVIVPIVNFMYTGMLEYHPSLFDRLYKAAEMMNIAILTKLLEAQLSSIKKKSDSPALWNSQAKKLISARSTPPPEMPTPPAASPAPVARKFTTTSLKRRAVQASVQAISHSGSASVPESKWSAAPPAKDFSDNVPKPTRFEWPDDDLPPMNLMDSSFDDISLTSKPLWTKEEEQQRAGTSVEESRVEISQKSISDDLVTENKVNVAYDDAAQQSLNQKRKAEQQVARISPKRVKVSEKENATETTINVKGKNAADLDHTKIVSEILKKYPGLMKKNKNIRLKIMTKPDAATKTSAAVPNNKPKAEEKSRNVKENKAENAASPPIPKRMESYVKKVSDDGPWICMKCFGDSDRPEFVLYYLFRKHMTDVHNEEFDSSLCKYCGHYCPTDVTMAFHLFTKHGLKPPASITFSKCPKCPFIAISPERMTLHIPNHQKDEVQCLNCKLCFRDKSRLMSHIKITRHLNKNAANMFDCQYCMKKMQSSVSLFTHIKVQHLKEAANDGIISLHESLDVDVQGADKNDREAEESGGVDAQAQHKDKVKIISNVKVAERAQAGEEEEEEEEEAEAEEAAATTAPKGQTENAENAAAAAPPISSVDVPQSIASNLAGLVDIVVLDENQQYILQQPPTETGQPEYILPELASNEALLQAANAELNSTDELVMVLTDHDYQDEEQNRGQPDNSNIVVLYSHPVEGQQGQFITSQGNLMVNSQTGMLEIHNGTAIATTAGQIIVSEPVTTDSQVESIEMIRKEIENHTEMHAKSKLVHEGQQQKLPISPAPQQVEQAEQENHFADQTEAGKEVVDQDVADTVQEEPMEVEEIGPGCSSQAVEQSEPEGANENVPVATDSDTNKELVMLNQSPEENLILNDTSAFPDEEYHESEQNVDEEEANPAGEEHTLEFSDATQQPIEAMEVSETEERPGEDVVDARVEEDLQRQQQHVDEQPDSEKQICPPEKSGAPSLPPPPPPPPPPHHLLTPQSEPETEEAGEQRAMGVDAQIEGEQLQEEEATEELQGEGAAEQFHEEEAAEEFHEEGTAEEFHEEGEEEEEPQSPGEVMAKGQRNVNQTILEDWEDTDSQQSEKQTPIADARDPAHVTKLMDDWEEEEEEEKKPDGEH
ncbi:centrosome-associated zinc finger protein CP190 isoform X2 [Cylas formicarius]|uniref:centrosome-associated zinc finger protein CP190 isoform X2 n=1 Tax=Cylas formicarius TaxID=197179 RepID=UPI0029585C3C|nr:centrosome-associated zinc finger protein CP190 isoform X2 [Cylas formicarius]